jgi:hypothetical protein
MVLLLLHLLLWQTPSRGWVMCIELWLMLMLMLMLMLLLLLMLMLMLLQLLLLLLLLLLLNIVPILSRIGLWRHRLLVVVALWLPPRICTMRRRRRCHPTTGRIVITVSCIIHTGIASQRRNRPLAIDTNVKSTAIVTTGRKGLLRGRRSIWWRWW